MSLSARPLAAAPSYPTSAFSNHDPYVLSADPILVPPMSAMMSPYSPPSAAAMLPPLPGVPLPQARSQQHQRNRSSGVKRGAAHTDNHTHHRKRSSFNSRSVADPSLPASSATLTAQQKTKDMLLSSLATSAQEKGHQVSESNVGGPTAARDVPTAVSDGGVDGHTGASAATVWRWTSAVTVPAADGAAAGSACCHAASSTSSIEQPTI